MLYLFYKRMQFFNTLQHYCQYLFGFYENYGEQDKKLQ